MNKSGFAFYFSARYLVWLGVFFVLIPVVAQAEIEIPKQSDWTDHGIVVTSGPPGSWDGRLHGMISPCTVIKKDGIYFLYYIGADGDRSTDGGPRHRALGVTTSTDGIHFTKYSGSPIITFLPHNNEEEGIFSAAGTLDENGNIILYYGAMDADSPTSEFVDSDVRLAVSADGLKFTDLGDVLSHGGSSVWGYGDELFPVGALHAGSSWHVYYIAKGIRAHWDLGLAMGSSMDNLPNTQAVLTDGSYIIGGGDPVVLGANKMALFIVRDYNRGIIEARTAPISSPGQLSAPVEKYDFGSNWRHATVFLDEETNTWFMYHREKQGNSIFVRTAPVIGGDNTPSTAASGHTETPASDSQTDLVWTAAIDPASGIASTLFTETASRSE